jgi:hypothetical protein
MLGSAKVLYILIWGVVCVHANVCAHKVEEFIYIDSQIANKFLINAFSL